MKTAIQTGYFVINVESGEVLYSSAPQYSKTTAIFSISDNECLHPDTVLTDRKELENWLSDARIKFAVEVFLKKGITILPDNWRGVTDKKLDPLEGVFDGYSTEHILQNLYLVFLPRLERRLFFLFTDSQEKLTSIIEENFAGEDYFTFPYKIVEDEWKKQR